MYRYAVEHRPPSIDTKIVAGISKRQSSSQQVDHPLKEYLSDHEGSNTRM